jgi:hypothetical protein
MKSAQEYKPNQSRGILLLGQPGSGKTTLALQLGRKPWIADCDNNLSGAFRHLGANCHAMYDIIDLDDELKPIAENLRFTNLTRKVADACKSDCDTLIFDSYSKVSDYVQDDILRQQGRTQFQMQDWGTYLNVMKKLTNQMRSTQRMFVATAHVRPEKDEVSGIVRYFIALPGQIQHQLGALFSDVWLCECQEKNGQHQFVVRTMPNTWYALKNSLGLKPVCTVPEILTALGYA